nr:SGNH/GDSL hydrolase family protein [Streptomyces endocoffeicus]
MPIETGPRGLSPRRRRPLLLCVLAATTVSAVALTGCGADSDSGVKRSSSSPPKERKSDTKVLWMGDSIAGAEGPALRAALTAAGVEFENASSDGGGTVVNGDRMSRQLAKTTWKELKKNIAAFRPNVIAYQITTYDWGTRQQQRASYEKFAKAARDAGAELVIVSAPPFKVDDFYKKYESAIKSAPEVAEEVAEAGGGGVRFLDSARLWGTDSGAAKALRAPDGIHSCQQGSAAFAKWLGGELGKRYGFAPAPPEEWAEGSWTDDERFTKLGCK